MEYIGISEDRLHHTIGVARKAYSIAKDMGKDEVYCRKCFMLGWLHDVGYEFSPEQSTHPDISAELVSLIGQPQENFLSAIKTHGRGTSHLTDEYIILNMADMQIDSKGNEINVDERLDDIKQRYGRYSNQYLKACAICLRIGLIN